MGHASSRTFELGELLPKSLTGFIVRLLGVRVQDVFASRLQGASRAVSKIIARRLAREREGGRPTAYRSLSRQKRMTK